MGNYCSSNKDKDNVSEKSEESPAYQVAEKTNEGNKEPPLAQPEPNSDSSVGNAATTNGIISKSSETSTRPLLASVNMSGDSLNDSPVVLSPPVDISTILNLPQNLTSFYGRPISNRRMEKDKKILLYMLSADDSYQTEKSIIFNLQNYLKDKYCCKGFEIHITDLHIPENYSKTNSFDLENWLDGPLEGQSGHHLAANCIAEIKRHISDAYVIPLLFLNSSLGDPLLPLKIECQDFTNMMQTADNCGKLLLEKWYSLDEKTQPPCYRLKSVPPAKCEVSTVNEELNSLVKVLVESFSDELKDKYLTTVVEQELKNIINSVNAELSKRFIWIQNTNPLSKIDENSTSLEIEMNRRLTTIHNELKNQLAEKHILKIPVISPQQQEQFSALLDILLSTEIDNIIEEHATKYHIPKCTYGVDKRILNELEEVNRFARILNRNCPNFPIIEQIKEYLCGNSTKPLVVYGKLGSGKSLLSAKVCENIHDWMPDCSLVLRYSNLTAITSDLTSIVGSITEQISVLVTMSPTKCEHTLQSYTKELNHLLERSKHQIVIMIDSIDEVFDLKDVEWCPIELPQNVKIILTLSSNATKFSELEQDSMLLRSLKEKIKDEKNFLFLTAFTKEQWADVMCYGSGSGDVIYSSEFLMLPDDWKQSDERAPIQAKILWWLAWLGIKKLENLSIAYISEKVFEILESKFGLQSTKYLISLLTASRDGLLETEIIDLLKNSKLIEGSVMKLWTNFCWIMGPLLMHNKNIKIMDSTIKSVAIKRYESELDDTYKKLHDYFERQQNVFYDMKRKESCFNIRKYVELPFLSYKIDKLQFETSVYLTDLTWLHNKINATGCVQLLNDIYLINPPNEDDSNLPDHLKFLKRFIEIHYKSLNYDAQQLYSLLITYIKHEQAKNNQITNNSVIKNWVKTIEENKILRVEKIEIEEENRDNTINENEDIDDKSDKNEHGYDFIMNANQDGNFVISLSTHREEICVWNVIKCCKVRTLKGVPQPTSICPVGEHGMAVLCKREIRVVDLNQGKFKVTLKGVMNQKMPYFGLHDTKHLVCLSRNRMYVNLMNLESGDCVTTFKAGEDRFLNSLLVSGDGRILVCGDETQKPFPLLVWHLTQRKLLYDLRIPHHDFITSLSAITHEGSYVCVVAKELAEPTPNFIVVYDLQSGTLFKKWKPSCNTVSLAISQSNTCVIAGLEDARILIWDLVTGNCRCTLSGHNAPVTLLKLDPIGKTLLSGDKEGRDKSIRLWNLNSGTSLAVYTSAKKITACELISNGKYVVLGLKNNPNLVTLKLKGGDFEKDDDEENIQYGNPENDGKVFNLNE